MNHFK